MDARLKGERGSSRDLSFVIGLARRPSQFLLTGKMPFLSLTKRMKLDAHTNTKTNSPCAPETETPVRVSCALWTFSPFFTTSRHVMCHTMTRQFKAFDTMYVCFAVADKPLLLPSLEWFNRLGIFNIVWRPEDGNEKDVKRLIRESSIFQICWSMSAKV